MNTRSSRLSGTPVPSRHGQGAETCVSKSSSLPPQVFPFSAASRFSPRARLFASAATAGGSNTSDQAISPKCRSRVKVWETTSGGASEHISGVSCGANGVSAKDGATGAVPRARTGPYTPTSGVEWSRQFLGHSVNAVLFLPTTQLKKQTTHSASIHADGVVGTECHKITRDEEDSSTLLIGTDKGMVAAACVSGGSSSKLLYTVYLDAAYAGEATGSNGSLIYSRTSNSTAGGLGGAGAAVTPMAAAAMGTSFCSAVYDLRALPGRSDAIVALVGCAEGSTIYLLNVEDGGVLQEDALSKCYTLMATASRSLSSPLNAVAGGTVGPSQLHHLALLGCGTTRKVDRDTQLDRSPRNGVLFLFDVFRRKQWLKLTGASSDTCCALALQDNLEFGAACFTSGVRQQQTQILVWKLPNRVNLSFEKGDAAKRKKLPPSMMTHFFEGLVQLLLPVTEFGSETEKTAAADEMRAGAACLGSDRKRPVQMLIGLSRSSIVVLWGCFSTVNTCSQALSFTLELLLQIDTATPLCALSCGGAFTARPDIVAAATAPGVWYIEEGINSIWWDEPTAVTKSDVHTEESYAARVTDILRNVDKSKVGRQPELVLRIVRGSYAAPIFSCVAVPCLSGDSVRSEEQLLYLPLLLSSSGKLSCTTDSVERPLTAKELKQTLRKASDQREDVAEEECLKDQENSFKGGAARELPAACLKRKIGAMGSNEGEDGPKVSGSKETHTKILKAAEFHVKKEEAGVAMVGKSSIASILRQAIVAADARLLESVLSSTAKDKKEVAAAVASLTPARALALLQHLVQQQQISPATSILKGPWIEELVKQHGVVLGTTEAGREQLVLLLLQVEERRRTEAALVKVKGRVELLLQQMQRIQKLKEQRRKDELEAREPLVVHREHAR